MSDETVILHLHEGIYYGLNSVGSYVWRAVQAPCELARIVDAVVADFEVSRDRCLSDVRELIEELAKHELVVVSAGQSQ